MENPLNDRRPRGKVVIAVQVIAPYNTNTSHSYPVRSAICLSALHWGGSLILAMLFPFFFLSAGTETRTKSDFLIYKPDGHFSSFIFIFILFTFFASCHFPSKTKVGTEALPIVSL